jgi:hypothetical protein
MRKKRLVLNKRIIFLFTDDGREKRSSSVTKEVKKILSKVIRDPIASTSPIENTLPIEEEKDSIGEQESLVSKSNENLIAKISTDLSELSENSLISQKEKKHLITQQNPNKSISKRLTRGSQKDKSQVSTIDTTELSDERVTKTISTAKELEKPARRTRAASVTKETMPAKSNENTIDEPVEKKTSKSKATKASSIAKEIITTISAKEEDTVRIIYTYTYVYINI